MRVLARPALVIVLFATAACSGQGAAESTPATDGVSGAPDVSIGVGASQGAPTGAIDLPADLPVDLPDGGEVNGVFEPVPGTAQDAWVVRVLYPADSTDSLVAFYDQWFADEGLEVLASRRDTAARWVNQSTDSPLTQVTINFEDAFYGGLNRLEVWYRAEG